MGGYFDDPLFYLIVVATEFVCSASVFFVIQGCASRTQRQGVQDDSGSVNNITLEPKPHSFSTPGWKCFKETVLFRSVSIRNTIFNENASAS